MSMMYNRLRGKDRYNMSMLTLCPIAYVVEERNEEGILE